MELLLSMAWEGGCPDRIRDRFDQGPGIWHVEPSTRRSFEVRCYPSMQIAQITSELADRAR
jgi:hypothetical protein